MNEANYQLIKIYTRLIPIDMVYYRFNIQIQSIHALLIFQLVVVISGRFFLLSLFEIECL